MKVKVDTNLNGETPALKGSTSDNPVKVTIKLVELVAAEDLPEQFEDRTNDRYQLVVTFADGEDLKWMPNKTSLKSIVAAFGDESDTWLGKEISIFLVDQNVSGKMKKVPYCAA